VIEREAADAGRGSYSVVIHEETVLLRFLSTADVGGAQAATAD
jgi:hypothetical protein